MKRIRKLIRTWKEVFGKYRYLLLGILIALLFYEINVLIASWKTVLSVYSLKGFFEGSKMLVNLSLGFWKTIAWHSYASLILIGLFLGVFFSLVVYRTKMSVNVIDKKGTGIFATLGVFFGVLAPGCAACGMGILSALGFGVIAVNFLPFDGLEISMLSIAILGFSISKITDKISNGNSCSIEVKSNQRFSFNRFRIFKQLKGGKKNE